VTPVFLMLPNVCRTEICLKATFAFGKKYERSDHRDQSQYIEFVSFQVTILGVLFDIAFIFWFQLRNFEGKN